MKRLSIIVALLLIFIVSVEAQRTFVLLTGVSNYREEGVNLANTTKDVKELQQVFAKQGATVTVLTSKYVTHDEIVAKLDAIITLAQPEDKIIFFFSGHGDTGGFIAYGRQMFKYSELINILSTAKTSNIFCFIDACMSGSANDLLGTSFSFSSNEAKVVFFMSSRANEYSMENTWLGNGFFTKALIKGLRGKADENGDKQITVSELFSYIYADVTNRTKDQRYQQHPQLFGPKSRFSDVLAIW